MDYKKQLIPLLVIVASTFSMATTNYNGIENWNVYDNKPAGAIIKQSGRAGEEIIFKGDGRRNSYMNGSRKSMRGWNNTKEHILEWRMKFSEKFRIGVYTQTQKGLRILFYDYKNRDKGFYKKRYIRIGLGKKSMNNVSQKFSRNLDADLKKYEPDNQIISVNGFKVQGSGTIESLKLLSESENNQDDALIIEKAKEHCLEKDKSTEHILCFNERNRVYVTEYINGDNLIHTISTENQWNLLNTYTSSISGYKGTANLQKLDNTKLFYITANTSRNKNFQFLYPDNDTFKIVLEKQITTDTFEIDNIKTIEDGEKLLIEYHHKMENTPIKTLYSLKKLPNIEKIKEADSELIQQAKEHCLGEDKSTSVVLCSNEKNIVYIVDTKKINLDRNNNNIYRVSIEKNRENIERISKDIQTPTRYPIEFFQLVKLKKTPIYLKKFLSLGGDKIIDWSFMYQDKPLFTQHSNDTDMYLYDIHVDELGEKLIFSYRQEYTAPYGIYTLTYDISDPNKMILIDTISKPLR